MSQGFCNHFRQDVAGERYLGVVCLPNPVAKGDEVWLEASGRSYIVNRVRHMIGSEPDAPKFTVVYVDNIA